MHALSNAVKPTDYMVVVAIVVHKGEYTTVSEKVT